MQVIGNRYKPSVNVVEMRTHVGLLAGVEVNRALDVKGELSLLQIENETPFVRHFVAAYNASVSP